MTENIALNALKSRKGVAAEVAMFGLLAIALFWLATSIFMPLGRDQGIFAWVGTVLVRGGIPYVDAWEHKGPAAHAIYALAVWPFGASEQAVRIFDFLLWILGLLAAWRLALMFGEFLLAPLLVAMMILVTNGLYWDLAQPDEWAGFAAVAMLALTLSPRAGSMAFAIAGALNGVLVFIKPTYALLYFVLVAAAFVQTVINWRRFHLILCAAAGACGAAVVAIGLLICLHGLSAFWETYIVFNLKEHVGQHGRAPLTVIKRPVIDLFWKGNSVKTCVAVVGLFLLYRDFGKRSLPIFVAIATTYVIAFSQMKWYSYQYLPYNFLLMIPFSYATVIALKRLSLGPNGKLGLMATVAILLLDVATIADVARFWAPRSWTGIQYATSAPGHGQTQDYCSGDFCHADIQSAAAFVKRSTAPGDFIYAWGFDPLLYVLADRPSASRFGFNYPLVATSAPYKEAARKILIDEISNRPPAAIAVQDQDLNSLYEMNSKEYLDRFPELKSFISERYTLAYSNERFDIYLRNKPR